MGKDKALKEVALSACEPDGCQQILIDHCHFTAT
jgi:hypothetical protein